jgi:hypothetical protein
VNARARPEPRQQPAQRAGVEGDAAGGGREARPGDMEEHGAAASRDARPGVVVDFDDEVVEAGTRTGWL